MLTLSKERPFRVAYFAGTMRPGHDGVTRVLYRLIDAVKERGIESESLSPIVPPHGSCGEFSALPTPGFLLRAAASSSSVLTIW